MEGSLRTSERRPVLLSGAAGRHGPARYRRLPVFSTQAAAGSTQPFSFAVFGDWGLVDDNGNNQDQENLLGTLAGSGVRFAVTTGDNGYPSGSQANYGDLQQVGAAMGAIFGARFWPVRRLGAALHRRQATDGLSAPARRPDELASGPGRLELPPGAPCERLYCCVNGTTATNYASSWYAFDAGPARFYVLTSAWGGTRTRERQRVCQRLCGALRSGHPEYSGC